MLVAGVSVSSTVCPLFFVAQNLTICEEKKKRNCFKSPAIIYRAGVTILQSLCSDLVKVYMCKISNQAEKVGSGERE